MGAHRKSWVSELLLTLINRISVFFSLSGALTHACSEGVLQDNAAMVKEAKLALRRATTKEKHSARCDGTRHPCNTDYHVENCPPQ